jgi:hypothetical protein
MSASTLAESPSAQAEPPAVPDSGLRPMLWALGGWLIGLAAAAVLPPVLGLNPFAVRSAMVPLEIGMLLLIAVALVWRWRPSASVIGAAAGLYAGWIAFTMRMALSGTRYGFDGLYSDALRLTALATRFSTTWHSADGIVGTVPSEYPPLYPWLVGRASAITGIPAWQLMGPAAAVVMSGAVLAAFLLWRRMVPDLVALAVAILSLAVDDRPQKAHEIIALIVLVPWVLAAFARPPRGRLHWLPAGIIGGLIVLTYQGYLLFAGAAIIVFLVLGWRESGYLRHVVLTVVVAAVTASWFLIPYLGFGALHGLEMTDTFQSALMTDSPFPFLEMTPVALVELIGVAGLLWYRQREWWATPLLLVTLSTYLYRLVAMIGFSMNGHTKVFQYTDRMVGVVLAIAGLLTIIRAVPALKAPPPGIGPAAVAVLACWSAVTGWQIWMPGQPPNTTGRYQRAATDHYTSASRAFAQQLPGGAWQARKPRGLQFGTIPVEEIERDVRQVRGTVTSGAGTPTVLSYSEQLYVFLPWNGYEPTAMSATAATVHWFSRFKELRQLAKIQDPAAFAQRSANTKFGAIDAFLLADQHNAQGEVWTWQPWDWSQRLTFRPAQFSATDFTIFRLSNSAILAVRNR